MNTPDTVPYIPGHVVLAAATREGLWGIAEAINGLTNAVKTATVDDELVGVESPVLRVSRDVCAALDRLAEAVFDAGEMRQ